jgi:hypothetical protein
MNKKNMFLAAMAANEYKRRAWVISAFSLINEAPDNYKNEIYPYRIVQTLTGHFYVNPDTNELSIIEDAKPGEPIYSMKEVVTVHKGEIPNLDEDIETTYGRILFNYTALINPFGTKLKYINKRISPSQVEELILPLLLDNPEKDTDRNNKNIYIDEYINFCNSMFYLAGFTQLCVPAATPKTLVAPPGINELKERLLKENEGHLHDPTTIAKIDAELVKYDREYMKGDLGEGFLIDDKSYNIVRKKLFGMLGAEPGLEDTNDLELTKNSLSQGWDINSFPAMNNVLRAGSFNRGAETQKGGESVKWLLRASSNINITVDDCGTRLGNIIRVNADNVKSLIGFSIVIKEGSLLIDTKETADKYIGKTVMLRSPMFCKLDKTDYCKTCVGVNLANNPTGASVAISNYGSVLLYVMMSAVHGSELTLAKMDYKTAIF